MTKKLSRTYWNGEPCQVRIVNVVVGKAPAPTWWCAPLEGTVREAVEVTQHGQTFFLDNVDESGWIKVTTGRGMPNYPHRSLPSDSKVFEPDLQPTPKLSREDNRFLAEALTKMAQLMSRKSEMCFHCGRQVQTLEKIGRSVYANPCGCRLWQGTVPDAWKKPNHKQA
jgi:hypothetical protein